MAEQPIGEVLKGLEMAGLPEGCVAIEVAMMIRGIDENGNAAWFKRETAGMDRFSLVGAITVLLDRVMDDVAEGWVKDENEEKS